VYQAGLALVAVARWDPYLRRPETSPLLVSGLDDTRADVRSWTIYATEHLRRLSPGLIAAFERRFDDAASAPALDYILAEAFKRSRTSRQFVPLLARIVIDGPTEDLTASGRSKRGWTRYCLRSLSVIAADEPEARRAMRTAILSEDRHARDEAARCYLSVKTPAAEDIAVVRVAPDEAEGRQMHCCLKVLKQWQALGVDIR